MRGRVALQRFPWVRLVFKVAAAVYKTPNAIVIVKRIICGLALLAVRSIAYPQSYTDSLLLSPDRVGAITAKSSAETLAQVYGRTRVAEKMIYLGEGYQERGTVVFPRDSTRTLFITWKDTVNARNPALIQVVGVAWRTAEGIRLGTTLRTLERLNGGPFTMTGFDWDYSGTILSWDGGKLETLSQPHGRVFLSLQPAEHHYDRSVSGDRDISSRHPEMQRLDPVVRTIRVEFY